MSSFGREVIQSVGKSIKLSADGNPEVKQGGVTVDWATVAAVSGSDVTLEDGVVVKVGEKYLRYGQTLNKITASGKYGPYDPAAAGSDGRELAPSNGNSFLVNQTMKELDMKSDHPEVIYGGLVFKSRLIQSEAATHTLALGPTLAELLAAFPRLQFVTE